MDNNKLLLFNKLTADGVSCTKKKISARTKRKGYMKPQQIEVNGFGSCLKTIQRNYYWPKFLILRFWWLSHNLIYAEI